MIGWQTQWGTKLKMLLDMKEKGQDPPALRNRPVLLDRLEWYFSCFTELSHDRSYTQGCPLRLSTGQIHTYWLAYGLHGFEDFADKIRMIDRVWSEKTAEAREKATPETPKGTRPPQVNPL